MSNSLKMKGKRRYLGSVFSAFAALFVPGFIIIAIVFGITVLSGELSITTIFLSLICFSCSLLLGYYCWPRINQLYSWGLFTDSTVYVSVLLQEQFSIPYNCFQECGIGFYRHTLLNSKNGFFGSNKYYIFLSICPFDEKYRSQINLWMPSSACIKVHFDKQLYDYLINNLPEKQMQMLERDYNRFLNT